MIESTNPRFLECYSNWKSASDLIVAIQPFVKHVYQIAQGSSPADETHDYSQLNRIMFAILGIELSEFILHGVGPRKQIIRDTSHFDNCTGVQPGDISKRINNNGRTLPKFIRAELENNTTDYAIPIARIFWLLQYYFCLRWAEKDVSSVFLPNHNLTSTRRENGCIEYFILSPNIKSDLSKNLRIYCKDFSPTIKSISPYTINTYSLSRIILDVIIEQINSFQTNSKRALSMLSKLDDAETKLTTEAMPEQHQFLEFNEKICFGNETLDRFNALERFAEKNCYAAEELATIYYFGKEFQYGTGSIYVERDYSKAIYYYELSIKNSNPPIKSACWSLGQTLESLKYESKEERRKYLKRARELYELAGDYPPAYASKANNLIKEGTDLYQKWKDEPNAVNWEDLVQKIVGGIEILDRLSQNGWFFGNNVIALFLVNHADEHKLIEAVKEKTNVKTPLDIETHFKIASGWGNLWATDALAKFYAKAGRIEEAKPLLQKCMEIGYNKAFYTMAMFCVGDTDLDLRHSLLKQSSTLNYPVATFELAKEIAESDPAECRRLLELAERQNYSQRIMKADLPEKIRALSESLPDL